MNTSHEARPESWTQLRIDRRSPSYWRVTFDHPPINTITATTVAELAELMDLIEQDSDLKVVVFDSANPDYFLAHYDVENDFRKTAALASGSDRTAGVDGHHRAHVPRARGQHRVDPRARPRRRERVRARHRPAVRVARDAMLGQFEVGIGVVPGGAPMARLARLVGRGRALEILLVADDFEGPRAEQYGYVNRAIADDRLDDEVDAMAARLAGFDRDAIARTKSYVDQVTLPADSELIGPIKDFSELFTRPAQQAQWARLQALGLNTDSDLERSLGRRVVESIAYRRPRSPCSRPEARDGRSSRAKPDLRRPRGLPPWSNGTALDTGRRRAHRYGRGPGAPQALDRTATPLLHFVKTGGGRRAAPIHATEPCAPITPTDRRAAALLGSGRLR